MTRSHEDRAQEACRDSETEDGFALSPHHGIVVAVIVVAVVVIVICTPVINISAAQTKKCTALLPIN